LYQLSSQLNNATFFITGEITPTDVLIAGCIGQRTILDMVVRRKITASSHQPIVTPNIMVPYALTYEES
jgi:hypothetical protein